MTRQGAAASAANLAGILEEMREGFAVRSEAQQLAANQAGQGSSWISGAATILAAIGGTTAFVSLSQSDD